MSRNAHSLDARPRQQAESASPHRATSNACFKPVALPAVAAAVRACASAPARQPVHRDMPRILRQDDPAS